MPDRATLQNFYDQLHSGNLVDKNDPKVIDKFQKQYENSENSQSKDS